MGDVQFSGTSTSSLASTASLPLDDEAASTNVSTPSFDAPDTPSQGPSISRFPAAPRLDMPNRETPAVEASLRQATDKFKQRMGDAAADPARFEQMLKTAFGDRYDKAGAEKLRQQVLKNDDSWMPKIEVVGEKQLEDVTGSEPGQSPAGAYAKSSDTVYLSREFLAADPAEAEGLLAEELGHAIDARINVNDAAGDEGAIFAGALAGKKFSTEELAALKAENDHGRIQKANGQVEDVEYKKFWKKLGQRLAAPFRRVADIVADKAKHAVNAVKRGFHFVVDGVKSSFNITKSLFTGDFKGAWGHFAQSWKDKGNAMTAHLRQDWLDDHKNIYGMHVEGWNPDKGAKPIIKSKEA